MKRGRGRKASPSPYAPGRLDGVNGRFDCVNVRFDSENVSRHALKAALQHDKVEKIT